MLLPVIITCTWICHEALSVAVLYSTIHNKDLELKPWVSAVVSVNNADYNVNTIVIYTRVGADLILRCGQYLHVVAPCYINEALILIMYESSETQPQIVENLNKVT